MNTVKPKYQSKTLIGITIATFCTLLQAYGVVDISQIEISNLVSNIEALIVLIAQVGSLLLAFYGRIVAKYKLT